MKAVAFVTAALLVTGAIPFTHAQPGDLACNQEPGNRFYWLERAFCDLSPNGPERAHGIVIWNLGISGTAESWKAPAPPSFRLLQTRGWDVIMLKRHNPSSTTSHAEKVRGQSCLDATCRTSCLTRPAD